MDCTCTCPRGEECLVSAKRLTHQRIEHLEDAATFLLLEHETLRGTHASSAARLAVAHRSFELGYSSLELIEEVRRQATLDQRVLVDRGGCRHAVGARHERWPAATLRHLKRPELGCRSQIAPCDLGDRSHNVGRELDAQLPLLGALSLRFAIRGVLLDGVRGEARDHVVESFAHRGEVNGASERSEVLLEEA